MPNLGIDTKKTNKFIQKHRFMAHFYNPVKKCGCDSSGWLLPNPGRKLQPLRKTKTERPNKGHTTARSIPGTRRNAEDASAYANRNTSQRRWPTVKPK